jgi:hypothetical protein
MARSRYNNHFHKLTQINRKLPELDVNYVHPIELNSEDLINYSFKYAQFLNYFNNENKIDGNWQEFYGSSFSVILSILEQVDFYAYREKFKLFSERIINSNDINESKNCLNHLFDFLINFLNDIDQIYKLLLSIDIFTFDDKIDPVLIEEIVFYKNQLSRWIEESNNIDNLNYYPASFNEKNEILNEDFYIFRIGINPVEKINKGLETLNTFFIEFAGKSRHQILIKKKSLKNKISLNTSNEIFTPNLALIKAFIETFLKLKERSDLITKKHLDHYFKEILSQSPKTAEKDLVHLVIIPGINYDSFLFKKDNLFIAENNESDTIPIVYKNLEDVIISQSKIKKIINLCLSYTSHNKIVEKSLYTKCIDIENPNEGIGNNQMAVFGNNQTFISDDSALKMQLGNLGFYLGSKILFQQNGERLFNVILYFETIAFNNLRKIINTYAETNQRDTRTLSNDLFKAAFNIYYSNQEGWLPFDNFTVTFDPDNLLEHKIEYNFKLSNDEPSFDLYNNPVHGTMDDIHSPLLKFEVNPNSFFNAYNLFNNTHIERIGFRVYVKNNTNISLRNNIGTLSTENPFQVFGPSPNLHSFIDIQNENIFNKYTKNFSIQLNWFDLPINENGFKEFYKEYESNIDNNSFQVGISSFDKGNFKPNIGEQQNFKLFNSYRIDDKVDFLDPKTIIQSIDFTKIKFSNDMNFDRVEKDLITRNSQGIIRLSLLNPLFGFGHKLFTKLFTEISFNNSKWYKKKKAIPNEPLSPSIKSISIDYILEANEVLNNSKQRQKKLNDITLIHIYPFGYEKVYPNNSKSSQTLIPNLHTDNQFMIGIDHIYAGQEMSIYFELEEIKSERVINDSYHIQWFYLSNNTWKPFASKNILNDTTKNLMQSGIFNLIIPKDITNNNTIINDDLYYIKIELLNVKNLKKKLKNIFINGILVERVFGVDHNNEFLKLPNYSIDKLLIDLPEIDDIIQPYENFKGASNETEEQFYIRTSELLRNKNRFVTIRDISQAILNKFNSISLVECLGNGEQKSVLQQSISKETDLIITLIPKFGKIDNYDVDNIPVIDAELLFQIKEYVKSILTEDINVVILNPVYEKIKINCKVLFKDIRGNNEIKIYSNLLNAEISNFIAPWIQNGSQNGIEITNYINIDDIIDFIKERPYISIVNSLSIIHFYPIYNDIKNEITYQLHDTAISPVKKVTTSLLNSIFAPVNNHQITPVFEMLSENPIQVGINDLEIGKELIIQDNSTGFGQTTYEKSENKQKSNNFTITLKL